MGNFIPPYFQIYYPLIEILPQMRKELQDKLFNDFPELFYKYISLKEEIWCPDGWFDLIYNLSNDINKIRPEDLTYEVTQIKSKFSGLRYYMTRSTPEMNELIAIAENKSYDICGSCGGNTGERITFKNNLCSKCEMIKNIIE